MITLLGRNWSYLTWTVTVVPIRATNIATELQFWPPLSVSFFPAKTLLAVSVEVFARDPADAVAEASAAAAAAASSTILSCILRG